MSKIVRYIMSLPTSNTLPVLGPWISRIREKIKTRAATQLSTDALMQSLDELGQHGGFPAGIPSNPGAFASVNDLLATSDVSALLHSSRFLKRARFYTFKHHDNYMVFFYSCGAGG